MGHKFVNIPATPQVSENHKTFSRLSCPFRHLNGPNQTKSGWLDSMMTFLKSITASESSYSHHRIAPCLVPLHSKVPLFLWCEILLLSHPISSHSHALRSSLQPRHSPSTHRVRSRRRTWMCSARPGSRSSATWPCCWERSTTSLKAGEVRFTPVSRRSCAHGLRLQDSFSLINIWILLKKVRKEAVSAHQRETDLNICNFYLNVQQSVIEKVTFILLGNKYLDTKCKFFSLSSLINMKELMALRKSWAACLSDKALNVSEADSDDWSI